MSKQSGDQCADASYERLTGVAYDPRCRALKAHIDIVLPYGFGGGLLFDDSFEYVRFWLGGGTEWADAGVTSVKVQDLPAGQNHLGVTGFPASCVASLLFDPPVDLLVQLGSPTVRAILSWNEVPPDVASPVLPVPADWQPAFGHVLDAPISVGEPLKCRYGRVGDLPGAGVAVTRRLRLDPGGRRPAARRKAHPSRRLHGSDLGRRRADRCGP
jgi:hypothetical protein